MASEPNFLLGKGEKLTSYVEISRGGGRKRHPYSLADAKKNLKAKVKDAADALDALPASACPNGEAVAVMTLHPAYLAKTHHPDELLRQIGLRPVGSRPVTVTPRKDVDSNAKPRPAATAELFVAGPRKKFREFADQLPRWQEGGTGANDLIKIEDFRVVAPSQRVRPVPNKDSKPLLEIVIQAGDSEQASAILSAFKKYLAGLDIPVDLDRRIDTGELSFIPVRVPKSQIEDVAKFSFLRVARPMPRLRELTPLSPAHGASHSHALVCSLPKQQALDPTIKVAVFDGGLPDVPMLSQWARQCHIEGVAKGVGSYEQHGLAVTSALLFGPLKPGESAPVPYARVDHYRVLDVNTVNEPEDQLCTVLNRIVSVLSSEKPHFANISVGPMTPVDDDVHVWTSKLDEVLSTGETLAAAAAGNTGESEAETGLNLIQPPADGANILGIGSCDDSPIMWSRASYSPFGQGRSPGIRKPDGLAFGGVLPDRPFYAFTMNGKLTLLGLQGTSFAAPHALRAAIGIRALLGPNVSPLALKAILLHHCDCPNGTSPREVGWGKICTDIERLITCERGTVHVIYQDVLSAKRALRFPVPVPASPLQGRVTLSATFCIATAVDPAHKVNYTRSGLEIAFRPDKDDVPQDKSNAAATPFFGEMPGMGEQELREDAHKWETVRHASRVFDGAKLKSPAFDVSYIPRRGSRDTHQGPQIRYAMIISLFAPDMPKLYDLVWTKYQHHLERLRPRLDLRLQT